MCGRYLNILGKIGIHGQDTKRLLACSPNTPRDIEVCISQLIIILLMLKFFRFFPNKYATYCIWEGLTRIPSGESIWGSRSKKNRLLKNQ